MIQLRQRPLFTHESFAPSGRQPCVSQDFDRDQAAEIVAFGQVNHSHPALAEHSQLAVWAELPGREWLVVLAKHLVS
jgi:hypothetical protein